MHLRPAPEATSTPTCNPALTRNPGYNQGLFRRTATYAVAGVLIILGGLLPMTACTPRTETSRATAAPLKLGLMPDADSLPFLVAREEGLFGKTGAAVELVAFSNAQERDAAMQAEAIDGSIADILAAAFFVAGGFDVRITSVSDGRYGIAAAPGMVIHSPSDLAGKSIGMSTNTIIQYAVDMIMSRAGLTMNAYTISAVPRIPVRMEMLLAGQIDGAGLPEPLLSVAAARGASIAASSDDYDIDAGIIMFRTPVLEKRLEDIKKLYQAYAEACERINANPDGYRSFLVEKAGFPEEARFAFRFVEYRKPQLPDKAQVQSALDWLRSHDLLTTSLVPEDLLDGRVVAAW
jgi:NitT/TauT family transport system substrate-binding protein